MSNGGIGVGRMKGAGVAQKGSPPRRRRQQVSCKGGSGVHNNNEVQNNQFLVATELSAPDFDMIQGK